MNQRIRAGFWLIVAASAAFLGGTALACSGNYCANFNTNNCISLDYSIEESCCKNLDASGLRCWTCQRDAFICDDDEIQYSGGYNCHSPGAACN